MNLDDEETNEDDMDETLYDSLTEQDEELVQQQDQPIGRPQRDRRRPEYLKDYAYLTYNEAVTCADKDKWIKAINEEKKSLNDNNTWEVIDQSEVRNKTPIRTMWIFKVKDDGRFKARLVAKVCE